MAINGLDTNLLWGVGATNINGITLSTVLSITSPTVTLVQSAICTSAFYSTYTGDKARFDTRRYDDLDDWQTARAGTIPANTLEVAVIIQPHTHDVGSSAFTIDTTWVTAPSSYPVITAEDDARAGVVWDAAAFILEGSVPDNGVVDVSAMYCMFDGIQIRNNNTTNAYNCTTINPHSRQVLWVNSCNLRGGGRSAIYKTYDGTLEVNNTVISHSPPSTSYGAVTLQGGSARLNNCTIIADNGSGVLNIEAASEGNVVCNNVYAHCANGVDFKVEAGADLILNNCASSDATASSFSGGGNLTNIAYDDNNFTDIANGDFTINSSGLLYHVGRDQNNPKTFDVSSVVSKAADVVTGVTLDLVNGSTSVTVTYWRFSTELAKYSDITTTFELGTAFSGTTKVVGIISDLHYSESGASTEFATARDELNGLGCSDVFVLGDLTTDDASVYSSLLTASTTGNSMSWHWLAGNHDETDATAGSGNGYESILGFTNAYYVDIDNIRFMCMSSESATDDGRYRMSSTQVTYLGSNLGAANNIVLTHLPLRATVETSREQNDYDWTLINSNEVIQELEGTIIAAYFCGHVHSKSFIEEPSSRQIQSPAKNLPTATTFNIGTA